jgi:membrane protein involved in colicin uptake
MVATSEKQAEDIINESEEVVTEVTPADAARAARKAAAEALKAEIMAAAPRVETEEDAELAAMEAELEAKRKALADRRKATEEAASEPAYQLWLTTEKNPAQALVDRLTEELKAAKEANAIVDIANPRKATRSGGSSSSTSTNPKRNTNGSAQFEFTLPTNVVGKLKDNKDFQIGGTNGNRTIVRTTITNRRASDLPYYAKKRVHDAGISRDLIQDLTAKTIA